ncbi:MAG: copper-binding protein [Pseudomonadota bacterium]
MKTIHTLIIAGILATLSAASITALADGTMDHSTMGAIQVAQAAAADMTEAEVRKVDTAQGKVTLKHGEIKNLDMPPMTMVFAVKDKAMLDSLKPGDKIRFKAADLNGKLTVVEMAPAR